MMLPLITAPGVPELLLILLVLVLLFGAKKLPELARGSGRALRIFKAETKGLMDDDDDDDATKKSPEQLEIDAAAAREAEARRAREEHNGPTAV
jgi:sec-independent protein translocase protein TatA